MAELPRLRAGQRIASVTAAEFNELVDWVRAMRNFTVRKGDGLTIKKSRTGIEIGLDLTILHPTSKRSQTSIKAVAITVAIQDEDSSMTVREVGYADSPPEEALLFNGQEFRAYSYWGDVTTQDYKGLEFLDEMPTEETRVLDARKLGNDWILERPTTKSPGGSRFAVCTDILSEASRVVEVQPMMVDGDGELIPDGAVIPLPVWPKLSGSHFRQHAAFSIVVELKTINGVEWVYQVNPWLVRDRRQFRESRCTSA